MFVRIVRFTDVSTDRVEQLVARIKEAGGPPPGVQVKGLQLLYDEAQGTAIAVQEFDTADEMTEAAKAFASMDASETPGTRVSVDECELKLDLKV